MTLEPDKRAMCYRNEYTLRCGHTVLSPILHCSSASQNSATGRWRKCSRKTGKYAIPSDELCGKENCILSAYQGRWICCKCKYGFRLHEVNRIGVCAAGRCRHKVCWRCFARTEENVRSMYADEGSEDSEEVEEAANEDTSEDSIVIDVDEEEVEQ